MDNFCVCCGAVIPEGRMVCPICEMAADEGAVTGRQRIRRNLHEHNPETGAHVSCKVHRL